MALVVMMVTAFGGPAAAQTFPFTIDKQVSADTAYSGDTLTYTIRALYTTATKPWTQPVWDNLPPLLDYVPGSATGDPVFDAVYNRLRWSLSGAGATDTVVVTFRAVIDSALSSIGVVSNIAYVPGGTGPRDTATTIIIPRPVPPELTIDKAVNVDSALAGDTLTYTLVVENIGSSSAEMVTVTDAVPDHTTYILGSAIPGGIYDPADEKLTWLLTDLAPGESATLTFRAAIDADTPDSTAIANVGLISAPDTVLSDTVITIVKPHIPIPPELEITKAVDSTLALAGSELTYTLTVQNVGEVAIDSVVVTDAIPDLTTYVTGSASGNGVFDADKNMITWVTGPLAIGAETILSFKATIDKTAPDSAAIPNVADIITPDTVQSDTVITTVRPHVVIPPKLEITKQVDSTLASAGSTLTYTLTVRNIGEVAVDSAIVNDTVPALTEYVFGSASGNGAFDGDKQSITWVVGPLAAGAETNLTFKSIILGNAVDSSVIPNTAHITAPDTTSSNTVITIVRPGGYPSQIHITKHVDSSEASPKSVLTYRIEILNSGPLSVDNVTVVDDIPELTSYVPGSASYNGVYDAETGRITWVIPSINDSEWLTLIFKVQIDAEAPDSSWITNVASIITPKTWESNPARTLVRVPTGGEDLVIVKAVDLAVAAPADTLHYTLTVTNTGDEPVDNVLIADTLSNLITPVPGSITGGGTYDAETRVVSWTLASIAAAASVPLGFAVTIDAEVPDDTDILNRANILAPVPIAGNQVVTTVRRDVFTLTKSVDKPNATNTDTLTYTIHYANTAGKTKLNVVVTDVLAAHLIYIDGSASAGGTYDTETRTLTWNLGDLAEDASGDLTFRVRLSDDVVNLETIANVAVAVGDNLPRVESEPVIVTVRFPLGTLTKTADPTQATAGDDIWYTVTFVNTGAGAIRNAFLIDNLPDGFTIIRGSVTVNGEPVEVEPDVQAIIPVGTIAAGDSVIVRYRVHIDEETTAGTYSNRVILNGTNDSGSPVQFGPALAEVTLGTPLLTITKTAGSPSGETGDFIRYTVTVTNSSDVTAHDVVLTDVMPNGFIYIPGSTTIDGQKAPDPTGQNPYRWSLGDIPAGAMVTVRYIVQLGANVSPGNAENTAWAKATTGNGTIRSPKATAVVFVITPTLTGMIRGKVIVDCNNDGVPDVDTIPSGMDVYLDDGSQSRVNNQGMFYFSAVRAGERVVALDERDLNGFTLPGEESSSVLVYVHENGESYVTFAICPEAPHLVVAKYASVVPRVKVTKTARLNEEHMADTTGVMIDYEIALKTNGGIDPTRVRVIDSFPTETRLIIHENQSIVPTQNNNILVYDLNVAKERLAQRVYYSLQDLAPGIRAFLTNKIHLECDQPVVGRSQGPIVSVPTEVSVGPFKRIPPHDISLEVIGALFETSKAYLRPEAIPVLTGLVDSIQKYGDAPVKVEGHADYRRIHTKEFPSNWELSTARAKSVVDFFIKTGGVDSSRITYEGFAATRPRDTGRTPEALQRNRRVEVFLKGRLEGKVDLSGLTSDQWSNSTMLELAPLTWDTVLAAPPEPLEAGLDDLWEIRILVENTGLIPTDNAVLADNLPAGTEIVDGSATVDGRPASFRKDSSTGRMVLDLGRLDKGQKMEVKYRIRAVSTARPTGGGPAEVKTTGPADRTTQAKSNSVSFP